MRVVLLAGVLLAGCSISRNESPVSFGVPDGMVLGRDVVVSDAKMRAEVVTFACGDRRVRAYAVFPRSAGRKPVSVTYRAEPLTWPSSPDLGRVTVIVALREDLPTLKEAARAMVASFEEVDASAVP